MAHPTEGHTVKRFDGELNHLHLRALEMGMLTCNQVRDALNALQQLDGGKAMAILDQDRTVDHMEVSIDEEVVGLIARRAPVAQDLRTIIAISKIVTDLERVADEAARIAGITHTLADGSRSSPGNQLLRDVLVMGRMALDMMQRALHALDTMNSAQATALIRERDEMGLEFQSAFRRLTTFVMEDHSNFGHAVNLVLVCKALERVGDHARNVAEYVYFLVEGRDVRHLHNGERERGVPTVRHDAEEDGDAG